MSEKTKPPPSKPAEALKAEVSAAEPPRQVVAIAELRWQLKEYKDPGGWLCVPHGTTVEDLLAPTFWANVARHLRPNATVQVHWDDTTRFVEVYVLTCGRNWASVCVLRDHELAKPQLPAAANRYGISFNGPVDKFRITRLTDNAVIRAGFASEREAQLFLDEYLRKIAA